MPAKPPDPRRHRGVALVVCLVLLTSLTLLAVATLRTATLELTMAGNAHYMVQAFELAQTGLVVAVARINDGELGLVAADGWTHAAAVTGDDGNIGHAYEATLRYLYRDKPPPAAFPPRPVTPRRITSKSRRPEPHTPAARNPCRPVDSGYRRWTVGRSV